MSRPGPKMGEHNGYVLEELMGLSREEVEALVGRGVVG